MCEVLAWSNHITIVIG